MDDFNGALLKVALGGEYKNARAVEHTGQNGGVTYDKVVEHRQVPPNPALLQHILDSQIGGEEDWC